MIVGVIVVSFVLRPLELFGNANDLLSYYEPPPGVDALISLDNQEVSLFATRHLLEPLQPALTRTTAAVLLFTVLVVVGYLLPVSRRAAAGLSRAGDDVSIDRARPVVLLCLAIASAGQLAVIAKVGGPTAIAQSALDFSVYKSSVWFQLLMGFGAIGLLVWVLWDPPGTPLARVLFGAVTLEICAFYALTGSRTRVFLTVFLLAVASHYAWRRWRLRDLITGVLVVVVVASAILAVRQATTTESFGESITAAPAYVTDPRGVLNDFTEYDDLLMATSVIGSDRPYPRRRAFQHGQGIVDAFRSYVPSAIDPRKPDSGDQEFRRLIFASERKAGRPYTVIGDLYNDFGFPGIAIGSLLFGILARALVGLLVLSLGKGREYRVGLYAIGLVLVYIELTVTYSVTLGFVLNLAVPFIIATRVAAPLLGRLGGKPPSDREPAAQAGLALPGEPVSTSSE